MSSVIGAKAISLVTQGRVQERPHARVFTVAGSHGTEHTVVIGAAGPGADLCTCTAGRNGRLCSHARAAHLLIARERLESGSAA